MSLLLVYISINFCRPYIALLYFCWEKCVYRGRGVQGFSTLASSQARTWDQGYFDPSSASFPSCQDSQTNFCIIFPPQWHQVLHLLILAMMILYEMLLSNLTITLHTLFHRWCTRYDQRRSQAWRREGSWQGEQEINKGWKLSEKARVPFEQKVIQQQQTSALLCLIDSSGYLQYTTAYDDPKWHL